MSEPTARRWREDDGWHIDVRGLAPPQPLVAVLRLIASVNDATAVTVHHDRDPVLLYPELAERGWFAVPIEGEPGEVRLYLVPPECEPPADLRRATVPAPPCTDAARGA